MTTEEVLKLHKQKITFGSDARWKTFVKTATGRKQIAKKNYDDLIDALKDHYSRPEIAYKRAKKANNRRNKQSRYHRTFVKQMDSVRYSDKMYDHFLSEYSDFADDVWVRYNIADNKNILFDFSAFGEMKNILKCYIKLLELAVEAYITIYGKMLEIRKFLIYTNMLETIDVVDYANSASHRRDWASHVKDFLTFVDDDVYEEAIMELQRYAADNKRRHRNIISIKSMFKYDEFLHYFLNTAALSKLQYYYPVIVLLTLCKYMLRTSELTLIKSDPFSYDADEGKYLIELPVVKRRNTRELTYISIPCDDDTVRFIDDLKDKVRPAGKYLVSSTYYRQRNHSGIDSDRLSPDQIREILDEFIYQEAGQVYNIIEKDEPEGEHDLQRLQPGDLRHIAMFNMISLGLDPHTIQQVARHTSITAQEHYYHAMMNMYIGKTAALADRLKRALKEHNKEAPRFDYFERTEDRVARIRNELAANKEHWIPIKNGYCMNNMNCEPDVTCLMCPYYACNTDEKVTAAYDQEMKQLEICVEAMKALYLSSSTDTRQLKTLANAANAHVSRAAMLKAKEETNGQDSQI